MITTSSRKIPIANIFYMLCYAWDILPEDEETETTGSEEFQNIYEFLGNILADKIRQLITKGFYREYCENADELMLLSGKIDIAESIRHQTYLRRKLVCVFDDFTSNILFHKIVRYTLHRLILYHPEMNESIMDKLETVYQYFDDIGEEPPTKLNLSKLRYDRNNIHYQLLMRICELLYECHIANESGTSRFQDFEEDNRKMARLFEAFLRNFYKHELQIYSSTNTTNPHRFRVFRPSIMWRYQDEEVKKSPLLPWMYTDIVIQKKIANGWKTDEWAIVDAKYYSKTLAQSYRANTQDGAKKVHAANLYQMYAYLSNWDHDKYPGNVTGMLIYPQVYEREITEDIPLAQDKRILVATVNLHENDWQKIRDRLHKLVWKLFSDRY